jgi:hypothetical protein
MDFIPSTGHHALAHTPALIPAKAGISTETASLRLEIPAFAVMTAGFVTSASRVEPS